MIRINVRNLDNERYYQVPKAFFTVEYYKGMSLEAKMTYSVIKDRLALSKKNGLVDKNGDIYLFYTQEKLRKLLGVSARQISRIIQELKTHKLIEVIPQGLGRPCKIYVNTLLNFPDTPVVAGQDTPKMHDRHASGGVPDTPAVAGQDTPVVAHDNNSETNINETDISETNNIYIYIQRHAKIALDFLAQNVTSYPSLVTQQVLYDCVKTYGEEMTLKAMRRTIEHGDISEQGFMKYARKILQNWETKGFKDNGATKVGAGTRRTASKNAAENNPSAFAEISGWDDYDDF